MQDDRHTDGRVAQLASGSTRSRAFPSTKSHPGTHESAVQDDRARGRSATHPLEVPARGWKDILFRVWKNIGEDRVIVVAAGVTFYSVLALFPAIAALVAVYGFFADPTTIASHLDWEAVACDDNGVASFNRVPYCHDQVKLTAASLPARLPRGLRLYDSERASRYTNARVISSTRPHTKDRDCARQSWQARQFALR